MAGSAALYQVAVALIPALLFGGATLQLRDDSPTLSRNKPTVAIVLLIIVAGLLAEIVAIKGAIDPTLPDIQQRYLVLVLTLGTAGVAFWIAAPLLASGSTAGEGATRSRLPNERAALILLGVALAAIGILGQFAITDSLHNAAALAQYGEIAKQRVRIERELQAAEGDDSDARARLISLARTTAAPAPVVHIVLNRLAWLDSKALGAAVSNDIDAKNVDRRMRDAFRVLQHTDDALKRSFADRVDGLDGGERELLLLAEQRMISAVRTQMITEVNDTISLERLEGACESVGLANCRPGAMKRATVYFSSPRLHVAAVGLSSRIIAPEGLIHRGSRHRHAQPYRAGPHASERPSFK